MKKIIGIFIVTLLIATILPIIGMAEDNRNKETVTTVNEYEKDICLNKETYNFKPSHTTSLIQSLEKPPSAFDLRNVDGENYVTSIKSQSAGTCWAHAIIATMESNLLMTGNWEKAGEIGEPNLAEYHLDWWNGFNDFNNDDVPHSEGFTIHIGGFCWGAVAYFSRGEGAVYSEDANDETEYDRNWFDTVPARYDESYHIYYPRNVEILDIGEYLSNINLIKHKIMTHGAIFITMGYDNKFLDTKDFTFYQSPQSPVFHNHNVAVIGWDDDKETRATEPGAWLCKNSWGSGWGLDGYFWISYYDKYCCHYTPEEWTVSFQDIEPMPYKQIYYYDYHGWHDWQDTFGISNEAFNAFTATENGIITDVSFYTCTDNVDYIVKIYDDFENGELKGELSNISGIINHTGFHTVELKQPVHLTSGDQFFIYLKLSDGGQPYDTSIIDMEWIGGKITIESVSHPGESYYYYEGSWHDLYNFDNKANFCIKGLISKETDLDCIGDISWTDVSPGSKVTSSIEVENVGESFSKLDWEITEHPSWGTWTFTLEEGDGLLPEHGTITIEVSVVVPDEQNKEFSGEIKIVNKDDSSDYETIQVSLTTSKNKTVNTPFLRFLEQHPHLFPLLRQLMGLQ
jgi:C1A family cysteine protease